MLAASQHASDGFSDGFDVRAERVWFRPTPAWMYLPLILAFRRNRPERRKLNKHRVNAQATSAHINSGVPTVTARASNLPPAWLRWAFAVSLSRQLLP